MSSTKIELEKMSEDQLLDLFQDYIIQLSDKLNKNSQLSIEIKEFKEKPVPEKSKKEARNLRITSVRMQLITEKRNSDFCLKHGTCLDFKWVSKNIMSKFSDIKTEFMVL